MSNEVITTNIAKLWMGEDNIIRVFYTQNANITLENLQEAVAIYRELNDGKPCPVLTDIRHIKSITREAREYGAKPEISKMYTANATIVGSLVSRTIINFFLKFNKPLIPTKLFTDENEALAWLKGFLE